MTILVAVPAAAQTSSDGEWNGAVGVGVAGLGLTGSETSFRTRSDFREGFSLADLHLEHFAADGGRDLELKAWGFGAEPSQHARFRWAPARALTLKLDYDERRSFFGLRETAAGLRSDDWAIASWRGRLTWDGWAPARLSLSLRRTTREGSVDRAFFGLNEIYPLHVAIDDTANEVAIGLESHSSPVKLTFEQAWTEIESRDRYSRGGTAAIGADDPDELARVRTTRVDRQTGATATVTASYGNERVDLIASGGYRLDDVGTRGLTATLFNVGGGAIGSIEAIDDAVGSADRDSTAARVRFGVRLTPSWSARVHGDHQAVTTDASRLGERLLRITNPNGAGLDIRGPIDESTLVDRSDSTGRFELAWTRGDLSLWAGGFTATRNVTWHLDPGDGRRESERTTDGTVAGLAWKGSRFDVDADYARGTFEKFIFRTDPASVDRTNLRIGARLGRGWELRGNGRFESAENERGVGLDHDSSAYAVGLSWADAAGRSSLGLDAGRSELRTETGVVLPGQSGITSIYDLSLLTVTARGQVIVRGMTLSGSAGRADDDGETWPVKSWIGSTRLTIPARGNTEVSLFSEYWAYDEERGDLDDYDAFRYGVALHWRFQ